MRHVGRWLPFWAAAVASGATYVVDTTDDVVAKDGLTSLREAVLAANTNAGPDVIQVPAGRYVLSLAGVGEDAAETGDLDLNDSVVLQGAGAEGTIVDGNGGDRVFFVNDGLAVTLADLAIIQGAATVGAGIYNQSTLRVVRCNVAFNSAGAYGGGIFQWDGDLQIVDSALFDNWAGDRGGGALDVNAGRVALTNSTLARNVSGAGAGIYRNDGSVELTRCTVAANQAALLGAGLYDVNSAVGCLVAGNSAPVQPDVGGGLVSLGFNLFGPGNNVATQATDIVVEDPGLWPAGFHGGQTLVVAMGPASPAINRGDPALTTNMVPCDQRGAGHARVRGLRVDIGALEHQHPDEDGDGLPDEWEWAHGFNPTNAADGALDADGDGAGNDAEYIADTEPTNALSVLRIIEFTNTGEVWRVEIPSSTACVYRLRGGWPDVDAAWTSELSWVNGLAGQTGLAVTGAPPAWLGVTVERPVRP